jgi:hypothetical protein
MARARRVMPFVIFNLVTAEETDRMISAGGPVWKLGCFGDAFNDFRMRGFLKNYEIRRGSDDHVRQCLLASESPESDVVTEQP